MKDEIKEILEDLKEHSHSKYVAPLELIDIECQLLLDYITNLQEENERLKEIVENLTTMTASGDGKQIKNTAQFKLDIYKQRIKKAVDLIIEKIDYDNEYPGYMQMLSTDYEDLLNILQGSDE